MGPQYQVVRNQTSSSSDHFGDPSLNIINMEQSKGNPSREEWGPTKQKVHKKCTLKVSRLDIGDNPERANIQGVKLRTL